MLSSLSKKTKSTSLRVISNRLKKGIRLLDEKQYKQASLELQLALDKNPQKTIPELERHFTYFEKKFDRHATLTIGRLILKYKKDPVLANKLGDLARHLNDFELSNRLYKTALQLNNTYIEAFYNLAASMGRVNKYGLEVKNLVDRFFPIAEYVLPEYTFKPDLVDEVTEKVATERKENGADQSAVNLTDRIISACEREIDQLEKQAVTEEDHLNIDHSILNLGLFALSKHQTDIALGLFLRLKEKERAFDNLDLVIALATEKNGDLESAIKLAKYHQATSYKRYYNANLGLLYEKAGKRLLAYKHKVIAASLLEKSRGCYHFSEISATANTEHKKGNFEKALILYHIVVSEVDCVSSWNSIGEIYSEQKRWHEAISAYKQIERIEPDSPLVRSKFLEIHNRYSQKGDDLFRNLKISQSAILYERAIKLIKTPETIEKLITVYKQLNKTHRVQELYEEQQQLLEMKKDAETEKKRLRYIETGKRCVDQREYETAIENLEEAFRLKLDKDVFVMLAHIYKGLNRKRMLESLVERWKKMNEYELKKMDRQKSDEQAKHPISPE